MMQGRHDQDEGSLFPFFRRMNNQTPLSDSSLSDLSDMEVTLDRSAINEMNPPRKNWKKNEQKSIKYVDDLMAAEHVPLTSGYQMLSVNKPRLVLHAKDSEDFFKKIKSAAESIGMSVNERKI